MSEVDIVSEDFIFYSGMLQGQVMGLNKAQDMVNTLTMIGTKLNKVLDLHMPGSNGQCYVCYEPTFPCTTRNILLGED
jgi:hypothetical protein